MVKNLPAMQETWVRSLSWEDPLERKTTTHSSILVWRILWTEESGRLGSMELQRVSQNYRTNIFTFYPVPSRQCTGIGFSGGPDSKESACNVGDLGLIPGLRRSPGGGHGNPLQYSCLENPHRQRSLAGKSQDTTERPSTAQALRTEIMWGVEPPPSRSSWLSWEKSHTDK